MSEQIVIEGREARLNNSDGAQCSADLDDWLEQLDHYCIRGMDDEPIPDNVKWLVSCGRLQIAIVELKPALRRVLWIDERASPVPFGPEAIVRPRRLATPYVVLKAPFLRGRVIPRVEVFYRNEPLRSLDGPGGALLWPNLLNVSPNSHGCTAWFCTQYLGAERLPPGLTAGLHAVVSHLWGGGFTRSSEFHEGQSAFGKAVQDGLPPEATDLDRWEAASVADPRFVLGIPWRDAELTVRKLIEAELRCHRTLPRKATAAALANDLLRAAKRKTGGK
jgi:hypothetical protein